jgi:hypothetical protein
LLARELLNRGFGGTEVANENESAFDRDPNVHVAHILGMPRRPGLDWFPEADAGVWRPPR